MGTKQTKKTIKLSDINIDTRYRVRDIDSHKIRVFKDLLGVGITLPSIGLDQDDNVIVGHHRYETMIEVWPLDTMVTVICKTYANLKERLIDAGRDNQSHGFRLTPYEEKRLAFRLRDAKATEAEIIKAVGRPPVKIGMWFDQGLIVLHPDGTKTVEARKGGISKNIVEVTEKQYDVIHEHGSGWDPVFHANQIMTHIENKTIDLTGKTTISVLEKLVDMVSKVVAERGAA